MKRVLAVIVVAWALMLLWVNPATATTREINPCYELESVDQWQECPTTTTTEVPTTTTEAPSTTTTEAPNDYTGPPPTVPAPPAKPFVTVTKELAHTGTSGILLSAIAGAGFILILIGLAFVLTLHRKSWTDLRTKGWDSWS